MAAPWVSVIMPTYNGSRFIRDALDGVVAQQELDLEVIVVDDGSTDETVNVAESYASRLPLRTIKLDRVGNWVATTNVGMRIANGRYLCWLHQDDTWSPDRLRILRGLAEELPNVSIFAHPSWYIDVQGKRVGMLRAPLRPRTPLPPPVVVERLLVQNFFAPPAPLFSRTAAEAVGWMDDQLWWGADWDFCLKMARMGETLYYDRPLASYRLHPNSVTASGAHRTDEIRTLFSLMLERHLNAESKTGGTAPLAVRVARFSADVNVTLAAFISGREGGIRRLLRAFLALGPTGWHRYLRDSRIAERTVSRLRVDTAARIVGRPRLLN